MSQPNQNLLSLKAVVQKTSLSRTTIWRLARAGEFPTAVRVSSNRIAWRQHEIDTWLSSRPTLRVTA
jgi:prophage regulatory protein